MTKTNPAVKKSLLQTVEKQLQHIFAAQKEIKGTELEKEDAVHEARVTIKKMRALLDLTRSLLPSSVYTRKKSALKKAKNQLGTARDIVIVQKTLSGLATNCSASQEKILLSVLKQLNKIKVSYSAKKIANVKIVLQKIFQELKNIKVKDWSELNSSLEKSNRRFKKAFSSAKKKGKDIDFHTLRKRSKTLLYQLHFIKSIWPKKFSAKVKKIDELQDELGFDHDLIITREYIENLELDPKSKKLLNKILQSKSQKLRKKCIKSADKIAKKNLLSVH